MYAESHCLPLLLYYSSPVGGAVDRSQLRQQSNRDMYHGVGMADTANQHGIPGMVAP
jgi:hypothetical protein